MTVAVGGIAYLSYVTNPIKIITPTWNYDSNKISVQQTNNGIIITGKEEGYTSLTINAEGRSATCIVTVSGTAEYYEDSTEPYIYSNYSIVQLTPGQIEQVNVSLYQGAASDIDGYSWTIDNPAICSINPTGQFCTLTANTQGYARIKITHTKSAYPYYIGVYVLNDISNATFITTSQNILSLNKADGTKSLKVDVANPTQQNYKTTFRWEIIEGSDCITMLNSGDQASITPLKTGVATVRVTNEAAGALYPLDIMVRVIEIVENVYIDIDTLVTINGSEEKKLTANLVGIKENAEYSNDDFIWEFENSEQNVCLGKEFSNTYTLYGLKNGSTTLYVSHPNAQYKRQILVIVEGQTSDAIDSSCFITTTQNFIKTKVGAEETLLNLMLKGGDESDQNNFTFTVKSTPIIGTGDVIRLSTTNGNVVTKAAAQTFINATAIITPLQEGEAVITVTNPKSYYPLEILVRVLNQNAVLTEPLYFEGENIITFLNSETFNYKVNLTGTNKTSADENSIKWETDSNSITVNANGKDAIITSKSTGTNISHLYVSHPKVENKKDILVITADTEEELAAVKVFYANKPYIGVNAGQTTYCYVQTYGYSDSTVYSGLTWTSDNPDIANVEFENTEPLKGIVHALKSGTAHITCKYYDSSVTFTVSVYPEGYNIDTNEKVSYLSTTQNVVNLASVGLSKTVKVNASGLTSSECANLTWEIENSEIAKVNANGLSGSITALKEGETVITVSHPKSANKLKIYVRIGSEYVMSNTPVTYITANTDIIAIVKDAPQFELIAYLVKTTGIVDNTFNFNFVIDNSSIATISPLNTGKCYVKPVKAGQTEITISHPEAEYDKKILVVIGNTEEELAAFRYLSTTQNVVSVGQGSSKTISVTMMNTSETVLTGYSFESENPNYASVSSQSANTCIVNGNEIGTTRIKVTNEKCSYPLYIIVQVIDPIAAASCPYIQVTQPVLNLIESTSWTTVTAELVGGTVDAQKNIVWTSSDSTILEAYGQNGVGKVRAKASGICYLTVSHIKAPYEQRILCICDKADSTEYSISVSCQNILSIKPNAGEQAITATLVNGKTTDNYNFNWSLDVYNIVNLTYSGNSAVITPLQEGTCTLTVSHPKSPYDQKIVIKVQNYDSFGFSATNKSIVQGTTNFVNMQVPASSIKTKIRYSSNNEKICTISGTNAVAQITGIAEGTCIVKAELLAVNTNIVQAESEMLVYVSPADITAVYVSGSPTVYTIEAGEKRTLSATVVGDGITTADYYNLKWKSSDPEICELLGASTTGIVMGSQIYALGKKAGEALITISHEKSNTELIYYVIVPGTEASKITLNKTYISCQKGETGTIKATITGGSSSDYNNIIWTAEKNNGIEICRVMGYGQEVTIYGVNSGSTDVIATLPNGSTAKCQVVVEAQKEIKFDVQTIRVQPGETKYVKYFLSPSTASLTWVQTEQTYFTYADNGMSASNGEGTVAITGIKEGSSSLKVATSYGNTATLQVVCNWDYEFTLNTNNISGTPDEVYTIDYYVHPANAVITYSESEYLTISKQQAADGYGTITLRPIKEGQSTLLFSASNPNIGNGQIFNSISVDVNIKYSDLKFDLKLLSKNGFFSNIDEDNNVTLADGETIYILPLLSSSQKDKADYSITSINFSKASVQNDSPVSYLNYEQAADLGNGEQLPNDTFVLKLEHTKDYLDYRYKTNYVLKTINGNQWGDIDDWEDYDPNTSVYHYYYEVGSKSFASEKSSYFVKYYGINTYNINNLPENRKLKAKKDSGYKIQRSKKSFGTRNLEGIMPKGIWSYTSGQFGFDGSSTLDLTPGTTHPNNQSTQTISVYEKLFTEQIYLNSGYYESYGGYLSSGNYLTGIGLEPTLNNLYNSYDPYFKTDFDYPLYYYKVTKGEGINQTVEFYYGTEFDFSDDSFVPQYEQVSTPVYYSKTEYETNTLVKQNPYVRQVHTDDTTSQGRYYAGYVVVNYSHIGKTGPVKKYNVYIEKFNCDKNKTDSNLTLQEAIDNNIENEFKN